MTYFVIRDVRDEKLYIDRCGTICMFEDVEAEFESLAEANAAYPEAKIVCEGGRVMNIGQLQKMIEDMDPEAEVLFFCGATKYEADEFWKNADGDLCIEMAIAQNQKPYKDWFAERFPDLVGGGR